MTRTVGKYGCKPPKNAPALRLASFLTGVVPAHPASADYLAKLKNWQMLGNDSKGDCVAVTWANIRRLVTATLATEHYPTLDQVLAFYATQNPDGQDNGMDIQTALEYLGKFGGPDGIKALGFAKVDVFNAAEVNAALAIFGSLWTGIVVQQANEQQFADGKPWDYVPGSPVAGGHSVLTGGYGMPRAGALAGDRDFLTWAVETSFTDVFWSNGVSQCWVVIWPEHLTDKAFLAGVNLAQFAADYQAITGKPFPAPIPGPPPFTDISGLDAEGIAAIEFCVSKGWVEGYPEDNTFRPCNPLLRSQVALIAGRAGIGTVTGWLKDYSVATRGDVRTAWPKLQWKNANWTAPMIRVDLCILLTRGGD